MRSHPPDMSRNDPRGRRIRRSPAPWRAGRCVLCGIGLLVGWLLLAKGPSARAEPQDGNAAAEPQAGAEQQARQTLARIVRELAEAEATERPWAPLQRGDFALGRRVLNGPPTTVAAWTESLANLQSRLRRVDKVALSPLERAQAASLSSWIRATRTLEESQARRRTNPLAVTREVERVLLSLLASESLSIEERLKLGEVFLDRLPARWAAAQESLTTPVRVWSLEAVDELQVVERLLLGELRDATHAARLGERATLRIEQKLDAAAEATRAFGAWLEGDPSTTGRPPLRIGRRSLEVALGALTGNERSLNELRTDLLDVLARNDHGRWSEEEARPSVAAAPREIFAAMRIGLQAGRQLFVSESLGGTAPDVRVGQFPGGASPSDVVRLVPGPDGAYVLSVEAPDPTWPGGLIRGLAGVADALTMQAEGLRRGPSGEALLRSRHAALSEELRMPFLLEPFEAGFGLYTVEAATRFTLGRDHPARANLERGGARLRLLEAARLLAVLEIHAEGLTPGEVLDAFRMRTGVSLDVARVEVDRAWHEPLRGAAILGYLEFRALEDELAERMEAPLAARRTIALALAAPGVRPLDLLSEVDAALPR